MKVTKRQLFSQVSIEKIFLFSNLVISFGILLVTVGGGWDISNHLLNKPETFFAPPHALLYTGVAIALVGSAVMFTRWNKLKGDLRTQYRFPVKIGIIGIFLLVGAGPVDFLWHSNFGLDGLLSPPHLTLLTGMFLCALGSMISIIRYGEPYKNDSYSIHHFLIVLTILPLWISASGFLYSFSLPFSETDYYDFNPEIYFAVVFATISMPFLNSGILVLTSKLANYKFGILSITGIILLIINVFNSILPNPVLVVTIPFYLLTIIPFISADAILAIGKNRKALYIAGAILGSTFFFFYFPLITHVYNEVIYDKVVSGSMTSNIYFEMLLIAFPLVIGPAIVVGIIAALFSEKISVKIHRNTK